MRPPRFVQLILNFLQVLYPVVTETRRYELGYQNNVTRWIERRPLLIRRYLYTPQINSSITT